MFINQFKFILFVMLFVLLVAALVPGETVNITDPVTPTAMATDVESTPIPPTATLDIPTETATATVDPTNTTTPTTTATAIATSTSTAAATETPTTTSTQTPAPTSTQILEPTATAPPTTLPEEPTSPTPTPFPVSEEATDRQLLNRINSERAKSGLPPYVMDEKLVQAARRHAYDMAQVINDNSPHTGSDGSNKEERIEAAGYVSAPNRIGEIVGWGHPSTDKMVNWWLNSPPHYDNIHHPVYTDIGIAYVKDPNSTYTHYWVVTFGAKPSARTISE